MFAVNRLRIGERDSLLASDNTASKVVTIEQHVETVQYTSHRVTHGRTGLATFVVSAPTFSSFRAPT